MSAVLKVNSAPSSLVKSLLMYRIRYILQVAFLLLLIYIQHPQEKCWRYLHHYANWSLGVNGKTQQQRWDTFAERDGSNGRHLSKGLCLAVFRFPSLVHSHSFGRRLMAAQPNWLQNVVPIMLIILKSTNYRSCMFKEFPQAPNLMWKPEVCVCFWVCARTHNYVQVRVCALPTL